MFNKRGRFAHKETSLFSSIEKERMVAMFSDGEFKVLCIIVIVVGLVAFLSVSYGNSHPTPIVTKTTIEEKPIESVQSEEEQQSKHNKESETTKKIIYVTEEKQEQVDPAEAKKAKSIVPWVILIVAFIIIIILMW